MIKFVKNPQFRHFGWSQMQYWIGPLFYSGVKEIKYCVHLIGASCIWMCKKSQFQNFGWFIVQYWIGPLFYSGVEQLKYCVHLNWCLMYWYRYKRSQKNRNILWYWSEHLDLQTVLRLGLNQFQAWLWQFKRLIWSIVKTYILCQQNLSAFPGLGTREHWRA